MFIFPLGVLNDQINDFLQHYTPLFTIYWYLFMFFVDF